jgi:hypothetical protein
VPAEPNKHYATEERERDKVSNWLDPKVWHTFKVDDAGHPCLLIVNPLGESVLARFERVTEGRATKLIESVER